MSTYSTGVVIPSGKSQQQWEQQFSQWAQAPSPGEQERSENAIKAIRNAINQSAALNKRDIKVFVQGSYRNRVNVREESDVDVGVMCSDFFHYELPEGNADYAQSQKRREQFGITPATYDYAKFKNELEAALVDYFGRQYVHRGKKAFDVRASSYSFDADVVPFAEFRQYWDTGTYRAGCVLFPDDGGRIENYPERLLDHWPNTPLHYENGVSKNEDTGRRFKSIVRILKCVRNEMADKGIPAAKAIPRYLLECLAWNTPDNLFGYPSWTHEVKVILGFLAGNTVDHSTCGKWTEVDAIKFLFHGSQPWTRQQANDFVNAAICYLGF